MDSLEAAILILGIIAVTLLMRASHNRDTKGLKMLNRRVSRLERRPQPRPIRGPMKPKPETKPMPARKPPVTDKMPPNEGSPFPETRPMPKPETRPMPKPETRPMPKPDVTVRPIE